jgi:hypothetical protein
MGRIPYDPRRRVWLASRAEVNLMGTLIFGWNTRGTPRAPPSSWRPGGGSDARVRITYRQGVIDSYGGTPETSGQAFPRPPLARAHTQDWKSSLP